MGDLDKQLDHLSLILIRSGRPLAVGAGYCNIKSKHEGLKNGSKA